VTSGLFAALALVCAFFALLSSRKCARTLHEAQEIALALHSLRSKVAANDSALAALEDQFHALRGKFYASRRKSPANADGSAPDGSDDTPPGPGPVPLSGSMVDTTAWKARMREKHLQTRR